MEVDQAEQAMEVDDLDFTVNKEDTTEETAKDKLGKSKEKLEAKEEKDPIVGNGSCDTSSCDSGKPFLNSSEDAELEASSHEEKPECVMNGDITEENSQLNSSESDKCDEDEIKVKSTSQNGTSSTEDKRDTGDSQDNSELSDEENKGEKDSEEDISATVQDTKSQENKSDSENKLKCTDETVESKSQESSKVVDNDDGGSDGIKKDEESEKDEENDDGENSSSKVLTEDKESEKEKNDAKGNELDEKNEESKTTESNKSKTDDSKEHNSGDESESIVIGNGDQARKDDEASKSDDDIEFVGEEIGNSKTNVRKGVKKFGPDFKNKNKISESLVGDPPFINVTYSARGPAPAVSIIGNNLVSGSNAVRMVVPAMKSALSSQSHTQYQNQFQFYLQGPPGYTGNVNNQYVLNSKQTAIRSAGPVQQINNKPLEKVEPPRPPESSMDMIELSRWEVKQGLHRRARNTKIRPESELSTLARFLRDFGQDLVKEAVYNDLVKIQQKRNAEGKLKAKEAEDFKKLKSVHHELREKVGPCKVVFNQKCSCGFRTESTNVMYSHKQRPHIDMYDMCCAYCSFSTRNPHAFRFHLEGEHNVKAIIEMKLPLWECNLCPYEHNIKNKLTQHKFKCTKNFKLHLNLHPAWMPGPETNFCLENMMYKLPAIKLPPPQVFNKQNIKVQSKDQFGKLTGLHQQTHRVGETAQRMNAAARLQSQQMMKFPGQRPGVPNVNLFQQRPGNARGGMRTVSSIMAGNRAGLNMNRMSTPMPMLQKQQIRNQTPKVSMVSPKSASATSANVTSKINQLITLNDHVLDLAAKGQASSGFEICEICGGYVKDRTALRIHFFYAHRIDMPYAVFDRIHPPLYCATCFSRFWTAQGLQKHLDVHKEDSSGGVAGKCVVCGHRVPNILMHMRIVHNKALNNFLKECKCIFCGTSFQNKSIVENHMAAIHGVVVKSGAPVEQSNSQRQPAEKSGQPSQKSGTALVKGSVCVLCNLNFGRNVDLTRHCMKVHHTCMKCGMVVADKLSLMKHTCLESPAGLRNCELCGEKGFHPAYHVKHIRDKHLKKCSVKLGRLSGKKASEKHTSRTDEVIDLDSRPTPVKKYKQCKESVLAIMEARKKREREQSVTSISDGESEPSTSTSNKRKLRETEDQSEDDSNKSDTATVKKPKTDNEESAQPQKDETASSKEKIEKTSSELPSSSKDNTNNDSLESTDKMDTSDNEKTSEKPIESSADEVVASPSTSTKMSTQGKDKEVKDDSCVDKVQKDDSRVDKVEKDDSRVDKVQKDDAHESESSSAEEDGAAFCGFQSLTKSDKDNEAEVDSANSDSDSD